MGRGDLCPPTDRPQGCRFLTNLPGLRHHHWQCPGCLLFGPVQKLKVLDKLTLKIFPTKMQPVGWVNFVIEVKHLYVIISLVQDNKGLCITITPPTPPTDRFCSVVGNMNKKLCVCTLCQI